MKSYQLFFHKSINKFWPIVQKDKVIHDSNISIAQIRKPLMNQEAARKDWNERGFSFGIFRDPPGQV